MNMKMQSFAALVVLLLAQTALAATCGVSLQLAYKSTDTDAGQTLCRKAAEYLSSQSGGIDFSCSGVTGADKLEDVAPPTFGGIHEYNDFFGVITVTSDKQTDAGAVKSFYTKLKQAGGLSTLTTEIGYNNEWLASCCSDPVAVLSDSCNLEKSVYGEWAIGCGPCDL